MHTCGRLKALARRTKSGTWLRPLPFTLLFAYGLTRAGTDPIDDAAPNRRAALVSALRHRGIEATPSDVVWLDGDTSRFPFGTGRALVRGHAREGALEVAADEGIDADLYLVDARVSPEGSLLDVDEVHNLTRTTDADEGTPVVRGPLVAYVISTEGAPTAAAVLDLTGHGRESYADLTRLQRLQTALTNAQATGRAAGVARTVFHFTEHPARAAVAFSPEGLLAITLDGRTFTVDPTRGASATKADLVAAGAPVRASSEEIVKPPTFAPWLSERLRAMAWFGDDKNQALKAVVFTAKAWVDDAKTAVLGDTSAEDVASDMGALNGGARAQETFTDPETSWPPPPLMPLLKPKLAGEGQWVSLEKDRFITPIPGLPHPFVTTFIRSDPAALQTRVYITLWDPRLVSLHMVAGTVEPVSATGEAGPGRIPRKPEVLDHVVAGFNGGFQATHGQFGMQADDVLYLPPKPYAATVMELRDGTTAFGAWPLSGTKSAAPVPEDVVSFRQNLTPLVDDDRWNPWGRTWWGGVPPGWHDAIHTTRTGLCITKEHFVAYFWGNDIAAEPLGKAMLAARCAFGMHLDMNPGLAGFEFYDMHRASTFEPLERPLQTDWEYEGTLKDAPEFRFRARRMIKSMGHILFPRYIHRDGRDFFYLTTRTLLPGAPVPEDAGVRAEPWRIKGLPQHGYPYALATTTATLPSGTRVNLLRLDPRMIQAAQAKANATGQAADGAPTQTSGGPPTVMSFVEAARPTSPGTVDAGREPSGNAEAERALVYRQEGRAFALVPAREALAKDVVARIASPPLGAHAAVGISDAGGMLQWVELADGASATRATDDAMLALLERLGCSQRGLVVGKTSAFVGGTVALGGASVTQPSHEGARFVRGAAPGATTRFDTPVVPMATWYPLQAQRVKWRPTLAPAEKPAESDAGAPSAP